jgi:hypothetical protein
LDYQKRLKFRQRKYKRRRKRELDIQRILIKQILDHYLTLKDGYLNKKEKNGRERSKFIQELKVEQLVQKLSTLLSQVLHQQPLLMLLKRKISIENDIIIYNLLCKWFKSFNMSKLSLLLLALLS